MIEQIKASVTFVTPIKSWSLSGEFSPPPGITAIIGRNGSGKSLLAIETPRYLLFGKKALRGMAGDYADYRAEGVFVLGGKRVAIARSPKREQLVDLATGVVEAVGAEAVTAKVVELLGYGLDVFDLANAAVQKKTDRLGQLRAAERKQLIDKVVGLADYEKVEKACREEASKLRGIAEGLTRNLRAPVEPVKPDGYFPSHVTEITIKRERGNRQTYDALLRATEKAVTAPSRPAGARVAQSQVDEAVTVQAHADATLRERERLQRIIDAKPSRPQHTDAVIARGLRLYAYRQAEIERGPKPMLSMETIEQEQAVWDEIDLRQRMSNEQATCPECGTEFRVGGKIPSEPQHARRVLATELKAHEKWAVPLPQLAKGDLGGEPISPREADQLRAEARQHQAVTNAEIELGQLPNPVQVHDLAGLRAAAAAWARYDVQAEAFDAAVAAVRAARADLEEWLEENDEPLTEDDLDKLQDDLSAARVYEAAVARYEADVEAHAKTTAEIKELSRRAEAYKEGNTRLADARGQFKALLAPLLSRIASSLIYDMSAGELSSVVVDDDMEITVDGQRIETLSGAGETVANLALRIALGQALVADAFPVFLGDEIDSDADEQRRAATKLALQRLKSRLSQIILVTHRAVDVADLVVDLDNPQELPQVTR